MKKKPVSALPHRSSMSNNVDLLTSLQNIFSFIWLVSTQKLKKKIILFVSSLFLASCFEIFTLQSLYSFTNQILVFDQSNINSIFTNSFLIIFLVFISATVRLFAIKTSTEVTASIGNSISCILFRSFLFKNYFSKKTVDSSEILALLTSKTSISIGVLNQFFLLISSGLVSICIFGYLVLSEPLTSLSILFVVSVAYLLIILEAKKRLFSNSKFISRTLNQLSGQIQDAYNFYRDIKIYSLENYFLNPYRRNDYHLRSAQANNLFLSSYPRYAVEAIGIILIIFIINISVIQSESFSLALSKSSLFIFALQKILPMFQQVYNCWANIRANQFVFTEVRETSLSVLDSNILLDQPSTLSLHAPFVTRIEYQDISLATDDKSILHDISVSFEIGNCYGIIGSSGSGKTLLIETISGLIKPTKGNCNIHYSSGIVHSSTSPYSDVRISYVPQDSYVFTGSIVDNILLNKSFDPQLFDEVLELSCSKDFISTDPTKSYTVYSDGSNLSSGQKQRLGLARALYQCPQFIILDEFTANLDQSLQRNIMKNIGSLKYMCIIVVAHRLETLRDFDCVIQLSKGRINAVYDNCSFNKYLDRLG